MSNEGTTDEGLAAEADASPEQIASYYDDWVQADYEADVLQWGYEAPGVAAAMLAAHIDAPSSHILDAGCGNGLVGAALAAAGFGDIVGGDFTPASVDAARERNVYESVQHLDLNEPIGFDDDSFDGVVSVGVFSYLADTEATIRELIRVTRPGGAVIFTQRTDLWDERECERILSSLSQSGTCAVTTSEPSPYLPGHPEFADSIKIIYTTLIAS